MPDKFINIKYNLFCICLPITATMRLSSNHTMLLSVSPGKIFNGTTSTMVTNTSSTGAGPTYPAMTSTTCMYDCVS